MRTLMILAGTILGTTLLSLTPTENKESEGAGIEFFEGNWQEALAYAKKENKLVFLDAYARWCGPCKILKSQVFTDSRVGEYYNAEFVNVKMDMERGEGPSLARKYRVTAYPSLFFIHPDGSVVKKAVGYHNPNQFISLGKGVVGSKNI